MASCINSSFLSFEIPDPDSEFKHHLFPHFYGAEDAAKPSLSNNKRTKLLLTVSFLSAFQTPDPGLTFKHPLFPHFYGAEYGAKLSLSKHIRTWLFLTVSFLSTPQTPDSDTAFKHHPFPSFLRGNIQPDHHLSQHKGAKLLFIASCINPSFLSAFQTPDPDSAFKHHLFPSFLRGGI